MMTSFLASKDLRKRLLVLRRVLPFAVFVVVVVYQAFSAFVLGRISPWSHFLVDILAYGVIGPLTVWFSLSWVMNQIQVREEALTKMARAETERQRAEEAAREQERLLAAVCSNSADAILTMDTEGTVLTWNRGAEMMFGYTAEEVVGQHFKLIVPSEIEARGELDWLSDQMRESGYVRNYETERIAKDGRRVIVDLTRTAIRNAAGDIVGSSAVVRDITERVRNEQAYQQLNLELETKVIERTAQLAAATEELRRRNAELERANTDLHKLDELKSEFVSMVSHELRAPLTNINGSIELLLEGNAGDMHPEHREMLQIIAEQSQRLTRLVQGILNVSRIEAGQLVLQPQVFNIMSLIEKVIGVWESRGLANRLERPRGMNLPSVWADRDRTEEVLFNLIDNAIKYSPESATIRVDAEANGQNVIVSVSDQGIGIPEEEQSQIFDKFHRVDRSDASETYGHGLGLYICRRLVEDQGGRIWVDSVVGKGSTFRFSLPLAGRGELERTGGTRRHAVGGRR